MNPRMPSNRPQMNRAEPPELKIQAANLGGDYGVFNTPQAWPIWYFNPGVMDCGGERFLVARKFWMDYEQHWDYRSWISVMKIHPDMTLGRERIIDYKLRDPRESVEDPRCSMIGGRNTIAVCAWVPPPRDITGRVIPKIVIHQSLLHLGEDLKVEEIWDTEYGGNSSSLHHGERHEKNWLWFEHDGMPHFIYNANPHVVCETNGKRVTQEYRTFSASGWTLGELRGGTPPVRVGDHYVTFFHSSMPWKRLPRYGVRRMYFMGAYMFEAKPPFQVVACTRTEGKLATGTWNEPTAEGVPAVVYPTGAILDGDTWFITMGVNDCRCAWMKIPHSAVMARMEKCS